jgi:hypothetical protein
MNIIYIYILKILRRVYAAIFRSKISAKPIAILDPDIASQKIRLLLESGSPAMIARFGSNELTCLVNYVGVKSESKSWINYIQGKASPWWWEKNNFSQMKTCAGFFSADKISIENFCKLMLQDIPYIDLLGSWLPMESYFQKNIENSVKVDLELLNPYFSNIPWTSALKGKKILVIHPFSSTIESQYLKRELIFKNKLLPEFELITIKAVQSIAGEKTEFSTWFEALDSMKKSMDSIDYDICLIGCGAYGLPLAAHAKRKGKIGFHLGGSLQLLFGISGNRWENPDYNPNYNFSLLMNEYWVKPRNEEKPKDASKVENSCYW